MSNTTGWRGAVQIHGLMTAWYIKMPACSCRVEDVIYEASHTRFVWFEASVGSRHLEEREQIGERGCVVVLW